MKLEKLTENKIRIIFNPEDLEEKNIDLHSIMTKTLASQELFHEVLDKAEKELDFYTDGCKLLIEAFSSIDGAIVFTITKYSVKDFASANTSNNILPTKKKLILKRKSSNFANKQLVCKFDTFDDFFEFCNCINKHKSFDIKKFSKNISLYLYNNTYYLIVKNINTDYKHVSVFHLVGAEFGKILSYSPAFENKLIEHGKVLIKKNAIK